ncbi:Flagellar biosynthetic protein FlhB [Thalassovita gelatinovora]|uniref:Flagellar biosynthetic protein FlhB n=1 Tax=Thalassovita gelatinovora TaxID=53501 RepID=A0A0P1FK80_THAGE|nr:flagellar type III secretion system protein FlhB [Thalassovita gelatinovora]QIZ82397.1 flagellar biosynthesis protein FlhB [Thalassovita gelatinovora]CUH68478.1 Flagellar biosynthetic protein FlhB [Thalassovita gelatinovora]SEQ53092.1 flagellar biosynthetic protein FlhB [Thalassovita gelatinovora]
MAESDDGQEKTEEPTPKKKQDARDDGKVITSKEMFVFASIGGAILILMGAGLFGPSLVHAWGGFFRFGSAETLDTLLASRLLEGTKYVGLISLAIGLPLLVVTLAMQAAMGGLIFSSKNMEFKFDKFNIPKGVAKMVSTKALVELGKALLKVFLLGGLAGSILWQWLPTLDTTAFMTVGGSLSTLSQVTYRVLSALALGLAVIGAVDLFWQAFSMNKTLKMTKQEIKDESKQTEGSPEIKGAIRRRQMEAAQQGAARRKALDDVPDATAIITNPKHFSVALRYVPGETVAPVVLALGEGSMAFQIRERAAEHNVRILQAPPLARAIYFTSQIGGEIHPGLYSAVATILAYIYQLDQGGVADAPDIDLPTDFRFDENGMNAA